MLRFRLQNTFISPSAYLWVFLKQWDCAKLCLKPKYSRVKKLIRVYVYCVQYFGYIKRNLWLRQFPGSHSTQIFLMFSQVILATNSFLYVPVKELTFRVRFEIEYFISNIAFEIFIRFLSNLKPSCPTIGCIGRWCLAIYISILKELLQNPQPCHVTC